jgi:hypothetical protein
MDEEKLMKPIVLQFQNALVQRILDLHDEFYEEQFTAKKWTHVGSFGRSI